MIIIGIDPGKKGAAAVLDFQDISVNDRAVIARDYHSAGDIARALSDALWGKNLDYVRAYIEDVHAMPKQGVKSMFTFGQEAGFWTGLLAGMGIEPIKVAPQKWQNATIKGMAGKTTKERAIRFAMAAFPSVQLCPTPRSKPHDGIADALCIAYYGYLLAKRDSEGVCDVQD